MDFNLAITPKSFGSNVTVRITAVNPDGQSVAKEIKVDVGYKATPPSLDPSTLTNVTIGAGQVYTRPVIYSDAHTPYSELKTGATSSNQAVVTDSGLSVAAGVLTILPVPSAGGEATITVGVTNKDNLFTNRSFVVTVTNVPGYQATTGKITIVDAAPANPYPSVLTVSDLTGTITDVNVTLNGLSHTYPQDVAVLVVPPAGQPVVLMGKTGGSVAANNLRITLDDQAASSLPASGALSSGSFKPTSYKSANLFDAPAPGGAYATVLGVLNGQNPNGDWKLFVMDDAIQDIGAINLGWSLAIRTTTSKALAVAPRGANLTMSQTANGLVLSVNGTPNVDYSVQSTSDLTNWSDAGTVTADDNGNAEYKVEGGASSQFFRVMPK
jgi:subtilisin-like proprotein convertase family protein